MNRHEWIMGKKAEDPGEKAAKEYAKTPYDDGLENLIARAEELALIQQRERQRAQNNRRNGRLN